MAWHAPVQDVVERVQICAAVVIDDALGIAGRARGVVERDGVPLVARRLPRVAGVAFGQQRLVVASAQALCLCRRTRNRSTSITSGLCSSCASAPAIVGENSRSVSSTLASPWRSMKAIASGSRRVLSVLSTAPHIGTPKCASYISGVFDSMTATVSPVADAAALERRGQAPRSLIRFFPGVAARAVHHRRSVRVHLRGPGDERQGRERRVVRRVLAQAYLIDVAWFRHVNPRRATG